MDNDCDNISSSCEGAVVSYPDPNFQQLRMDYITATWKVGLQKCGSLCNRRGPLCNEMVSAVRMHSNCTEERRKEAMNDCNPNL